MLPFVTLLVPAGAAVALAAPVILVNNLSKLVLLRGSLDRAFLARTLTGAIPGALAGSLLLGVVPDGVVRRGIGVFLIAYVAVSVFAPAYAPHVGRRGAVGWGVATGILSGLIGAGGPTCAVAMRGYGLDRQRLVATGAAISIGMQLVKLPVFAAIGLIRSQHIPLMIALCATALLAAFAGRALLARLDAEVFERVLLVALLILGVTMTLGSPGAPRPAADSGHPGSRSGITVARERPPCQASASEDS